MSLEIVGVNPDGGGDVVVVLFEVVSVVVEGEVVSVVVDPVVSADVDELEDTSVEVGSLGGAVDAVLSVLPVIPDTIPNAPEAITPAQSRAPSPRTIPARRKCFRPFMSPAPLSPQIRRIR